VKLIHPQFVLPLTLIVLGTFAAFGRFDLVQLSRVQQFWPVSLIALGVEQIWFWSRSRNGK
jgi:Domain of unknown function (DUF5668)